MSFGGPARGGVRGGKDQFNWDSVKTDKDREFYLGHSVKASVGRWQKNKDIFWYTRDKGSGAGSVQDEVAAIKEEEERLMQEALGLRPKTERRVESTMGAEELKEFLKRSGEGDDAAAANTEGETADRVKGVGFSRLATVAGGTAARETLDGVGMTDAGDPAAARGAAAGDSRQRLPEPPAKRAAPSDSDSSGDSESDGRTKKRSKQEKKEKKEAKKAAKKAKKAAKKEAKREKKDRGERDRV